MGGGGQQSTGESWSRTSPGFMNELGSVLRSNMEGTTGFSKEDAINDVQGVIRQNAINTMQESLPKIAGMTNTAGAYDSTTKHLLNNDLQARIAGQAMATTSQAIKDYAAIDSDRIRAFASATQAGTGSEMQHWESASSRNKNPFLDGLGSAVVGGAVGAIGDATGWQDGGIVPKKLPKTTQEELLDKFIETYGLTKQAETYDTSRKPVHNPPKKGDEGILNKPPASPSQKQTHKPGLIVQNSTDPENDPYSLFSIIGSI